MSLDRFTRCFFDTSCLLAAAGSPTGGSSFLLTLCQENWLQALVSQWVLMEAERNISAKLSPAAAERYHALLHQVPFQFAPVPAPSELRLFAQVVGELF